MKKKNKIVIGIVMVVLIGIIAFPYLKNYLVYSYGKRDVQSEAALFTSTTKNIVAEFTANTAAANKKYLEKPVAVSGTITSINNKEVILDETVNCNLTSGDATLKEGQAVTIKGRVVGYDDLLGELKLDQCNLNK
jgi:hypothetical protein